MSPARSRGRLALTIVALVLFAGFAALGTWQLQRLQWKTALIARVDQRVAAAPVPAPGPERWSAVSAAGDEYRHVRLSGVFLHHLATPVQAVTALGGGYWLLTPLRQADGSIVLVNRGFVKAAPAPAAPPPGAPVAVTGLLRISEPGGGFLRDNDPSHNRWFSRDVRAIAAARGLSPVAPYFVDADAGTDDASGPIGGLTVISFHNNHLVYALTWYALAAMVAGAWFWIRRQRA
ncbi:MAG: SURF1 family protein [Massilia sp.]